MKFVNIWSDRPYPPFLMRAVVEATVFGFKKLYPKSEIKSGGNYWHNGLTNYFYREKELSETVINLANDALKRPQLIFNFLKKLLANLRNFDNFLRNLY